MQGIYRALSMNVLLDVNRLQNNMQLFTADTACVRMP